MIDIQTLASAWFTRHAQAWAKAADDETKKRSLKDADGNPVHILINSNSPLKEFCETSYRYRSSDFSFPSA